MLTEKGCQERRSKLLKQIQSHFNGDLLCLADPIHLMYLANFSVDPFSLGGGFGGILLLDRDGRTRLFHDDRLPDSVELAHVDQCTVVPWYDAQKPAACTRQLAPIEALRQAGIQEPIHDHPDSATGPLLIDTIGKLRRQKDPDEIALMRRCMRATEAGHAWARANAKPGMTELDVYRGINSACIQAAGHAVIVYGDFAVSPGPERRGGPPTDRVIEPGDMLILDFSVVIGGYRSDFTNTLVVGREPRQDQLHLYKLVTEAMAAGERELRGGQSCLTVYQAVNEVFAKAGLAKYFPHHAGHGLGLTHPEAPYLVREANESLLAGDVITLEPGLYVPDVGGIRIENNYLITATGYEKLSNHVIELK